MIEKNIQCYGEKKEYYSIDEKKRCEDISQLPIFKEILQKENELHFYKNE